MRNPTKTRTTIKKNNKNNINNKNKIKKTHKYRQM